MSNMVILMSDEHNPFYSSVYGHSFVRTPNMDKMVKHGSVFINAYCPSHLCLPSCSAFVSGKRIHEIQTYSNGILNLNRHYTSLGRELGKQDIYAA